MAKKILCTLGPASLNPDTLARLDLLGVDLFRLNLSHTPVDRIEEFVSLIREHSDIPICLDTQGAQARTGSFVDGIVSLQQGEIVDFVPTTTLGDGGRVPLHPAAFLRQLEVGDLLSIDFDSVLLQVVESGATCRGWVVSGGTIGSNKAISIIDRPLILPAMTDTDYAAIDVGIRLDIPSVALSFANSRSDVELLRSIVGNQVQIIAKIESRRGADNLVEILDIADAILIDRGDLSREVPLEGLPFIQKQIIQHANDKQVPVYVATNLLESMVASSQPTRAEVNDVINTLLDGADGLVLAAETAIGKHPVQCVAMIKALIHQYESRITSPQRVLSAQLSPRLISPHGGKLVNRVLTGYDSKELEGLLSCEVDELQMMDARQIAVGTFSPLEGFMGRDELESVLANNRLLNGTVWTMPILFQLPAVPTPEYATGETLALCTRGKAQALIKISESFTYDLSDLAEKWFGTSDQGHPGVRRLMQGSNHFLAGEVDLLAQGLEHQQTFELTPVQARLVFDHLRWERVIGFHTRNAAHRAHEYLQDKALVDHHGDGLFIHPVVGPKKAGDFASQVIMKTYQLSIASYYPPGQVVLGAFANYPRYGGPREAVFTALCRQNFGCSHFIVGRDHTGVNGYYSPDGAQRLFNEIGDFTIQPIFFGEVYYCERCAEHVEGCKHGHEFSQRITGTWARDFLSQGNMLPEWYMREPVSRLILDEMKNGSDVFAV